MSMRLMRHVHEMHFPRGEIPPFPETPSNPDPLLVGLRVFFRSRELVQCPGHSRHQTLTHSRCQGLMENARSGPGVHLFLVLTLTVNSKQPQNSQTFNIIFTVSVLDTETTINKHKQTLLYFVVNL